MYIHLGDDCAVKESEIIGIFDIENTSVSKDTRGFLSKVSKDGEVIYLTDDLPKSVIVCSGKDKKKRVYISRVSVQTIKKRTV